HVPPAAGAAPAELTARGRRQLTMASAAVRRVEHDMLANLEAGEQDQMRRLLTACIASLTEPPAPATYLPGTLRLALFPADPPEELLSSGRWESARLLRPASRH